MFHELNVYLTGAEGSSEGSRVYTDGMSVTLFIELQVKTLHCIDSTRSTEKCTFSTVQTR